MNFILCSLWHSIECCNVNLQKEEYSAMEQVYRKEQGQGNEFEYFQVHSLLAVDATFWRESFCFS